MGVGRSGRQAAGEAVTIALVGDGMLGRPYAGAVISGVHAAAADGGATVVLAHRGRSRAIAEVDLGELAARQVIGVIIASDGTGPAEVSPALRQLPCVLLNTGCLPATGGIVADHERAARTVIRELVEAGHSRIGYLGCGAGTPGDVWLRDVARAMLERETFDPELLITDSPDAAGGCRATLAALRLPRPPTALVCLNGRMAMGAYQAAEEAGVAIPGQLSVVALDDSEVPGDDLRPPLTTVQLPYFRMGQEAVRSLVGLIRDSNEAAGEIKVACDIVRRRSVGPVRA